MQQPVIVNRCDFFPDCSCATGIDKKAFYYITTTTYRAGDKWITPVVRVFAFLGWALFWAFTSRASLNFFYCIVIK